MGILIERKHDPKIEEGNYYKNCTFGNISMDKLEDVDFDNCSFRGRLELGEISGCCIDRCNFDVVIIKKIFQNTHIINSYINNIEFVDCEFINMCKYPMDNTKIIFLFGLSKDSHYVFDRAIVKKVIITKKQLMNFLPIKAYKRPDYADTLMYAQLSLGHKLIINDNLKIDGDSMLSKKVIEHVFQQLVTARNNISIETMNGFRKEVDIDERKSGAKERELLGIQFIDLEFHRETFRGIDYGMNYEKINSGEGRVSIYNAYGEIIVVINQHNDGSVTGEYCEPNTINFLKKNFINCQEYAGPRDIIQQLLYFGDAYIVSEFSEKGSIIIEEIWDYLFTSEYKMQVEELKYIVTSIPIPERKRDAIKIGKSSVKYINPSILKNLQGYREKIFIDVGYDITHFYSYRTQ